MDFNSISGINLYAYCNNNPVMNYDPEGNSFVGLIVALIIAAAVVVTVNDVNHIKELTATAEEENIHIENSYLIVTPWVQMFYAAYLKYFNTNTKGIIKGSVFGAQYEWITHNFAYYFGYKTDRSKDLDLGKTIFSNTSAGVDLFYRISYPVVTTLFVPWPFSWLVYIYDKLVS